MPLWQNAISILRIDVPFGEKLLLPGMKSKYPLIYKGGSFEEAEKTSNKLLSMSTPQERMDTMKQLIQFEMARKGMTPNEFRFFRSTAVIKRGKS